MSRPSIAALKRKIMADLPPDDVDPARVPEFEAAFGSSVIEAADMAVLLAGTLPPADLAAAVGRLARSLIAAIATAADELDVATHPWIAEAQRWAVSAYFARIVEMSHAAGPGGRA